MIAALFLVAMFSTAEVVRDRQAASSLGETTRYYITTPTQPVYSWEPTPGVFSGLCVDGGWKRLMQDGKSYRFRLLSAGLPDVEVFLETNSCGQIRLLTDPSP